LYGTLSPFLLAFIFLIFPKCMVLGKEVLAVNKGKLS
jgi:hypothetical protein